MTQHDEREEGPLPCSACGRDVGFFAADSYEDSTGVVLCPACAIKRGGVYDPEQDRWLVPPKVGDLQSDVRPHL